jgi:nucleotidyltransferase/DNA polymerase involved in DNA repair
MRSVVHWDGDCFFASIEQASDRRLRGRPVAVGGVRRGVVVSASREARRFGVRPGMAMGKARWRCATLVTLPGHFDLYEQFFQDILALCQEETPLVEPAAVGSAYLDLTGTEALRQRDAAGAVERLRRTVEDWLRVSISAGISSNKTVARIAARLHKPGAQVAVPAGGEASFLAPLELGWLPGAGSQPLTTLEVAGIRTIGQLARAPLGALRMVLGRDALAWQRRAQGIDEEPVTRKPAAARAERESIEFPEDVWDEPFVLNTLMGMLDRLLARIRAGGVEIRRLALALRYTDRNESERTITLPEPSNLETDFRARLPELLRSAWSRRVRLRALTLRAGDLYQPSPQLELFETATAREKEQRLAAAIDKLRGTFGTAAVRRGYELRGVAQP